MSPNHSCWRRAAVGVVVCLCTLTALTAFADSSNPVPSITGYVYLDTNRNGILDQGDWAIVGAKVQLHNANDPNFMLSVMTDNFGRYTFDGPSANVHSGLDPATYSLEMMDPASQHGVDTKGQLLDLQTGLAVFPQDWGDTPAQDDCVNNIKLSATTRGVNYDFGEFIYPIELVSKQMLLTTYPGNPVPEPGVLALLAGATMILGVRISRRRKNCLASVSGTRVSYPQKAAGTAALRWLSQ
jgi:hypothetical protein